MLVKKILIVAAHPDDEVLGCGATVARMVREGWQAHTVILGEGITSRDEGRDRSKRDADIQRLRQEVRAANRILGIRDVVLHDLPDNRFDSVPLLDVVKLVEAARRVVGPDIILTHFKGDLNIDHRITYEAVLTAARPCSGRPVREIYSFEVLSSTEWNCPVSFSPHVFFDVGGELKTKLRAMAAYRSETRPFPHPRSPEGIAALARYRGIQAGFAAAEAFECVRMVR